MYLPFCLDVIQHVLPCHSIKRICSFFFFFSPCVPAGTLSVCVTEKFAEPLLHTVALQFLCTIFTEEAKSRSGEATAPDSKYAAALSDIMNGPSASQLCELLLQVGRGGTWYLLVRSWLKVSAPLMVLKEFVIACNGHRVPLLTPESG